MFFPISKVLWALAQPSSLVALLLTAGVILALPSRRRFAGALLVAGLLALWIGGYTPLGDILIQPLENRFPRPDLERDGRPVAGLIILGGAQDTAAGAKRELAGLNEAAERITEAVALAHRFPQARVVFSGGSGALLRSEPPEAVSAGRLLEALGVARERLTLEGRSRDTYENAVFTAGLLKPAAGERWLLITSAWHMPRAMGCFRKAGLAVQAWPVDYRTGDPLDLTRFHGSYTEGLRRIDFVMREYAGLVFYYLAGRTDALLPGPANRR